MVLVTLKQSGSSAQVFKVTCSSLEKHELCVSMSIFSKAYFQSNIITLKKMMKIILQSRIGTHWK